MKNLFSLSKEEQEQQRAEQQELRTKLAAVENELALYDYPGWQIFLARLRDIEQRETEALIGGNPEEIPAIRARIKLVRHLAGIKADLETQQARLLTLLVKE